MEKTHYNILVRGKVQGVWFRKFTKDKADLLGINGFVQNELEDKVYIEAEGRTKALNKFMEFLNDGPKLSKVTEVIYDLGELQNFKTFEIRYEF